jgi:hypothetical protein
MGTCEPYVDAWAGGPIRFYAPLQGCDIQEEVRLSKESQYPRHTCTVHNFVLEAYNTLTFYLNGPLFQQPPYAEGNGAGAGPAHQHRQLRALQQPSLLAFDLSPHSAGPQMEDGDVLRAAFPQKAFLLIRQMQQAVSAIRPASVLSDLGNEEDFLQPHPVTMHIERTPADFCGVCGVDSIEGAGSAGCMYEKSCNASLISSMSMAALQRRDHSSSQAARRVQTTEVEQYLQSPDEEEARFIVLASLDIIMTAPSNATFDMTILKEALSHSLGAEVDDPYHQVSGGGAVQVEVVPSAVDEMFAHMFHDELRDEGGRTFMGRRRRILGEGGEGMDGDIMLESRKHRVILTTTSQSKKEAILQALGVQNPVEQASRRLWVTDEDADAVTSHFHETSERNDTDSTPTLAERVASYLDQHAGEAKGSIDDVALRFQRMLYIPPYDADFFLNIDPWVHNYGHMSVRVMDPAKPLLPLSGLMYGRAYKLIIENFPPRSIVGVAAIRAASKGGVEDSVIPRLLATVTTDDTGTAVMPDLKFPSTPLFPPGDYEIKATVLRTFAYGLSPLYTLSQEGPKRKLYGTRLWA